MNPQTVPFTFLALCSGMTSYHPRKEPMKGLLCILEGALKEILQILFVSLLVSDAVVLLLSVSPVMRQ